MDKTQVLEKLQQIFREVFENDEITITPLMTSEDIDEWDSLSHMVLVSEIQKRFKIKFSSKESYSWSNIGELADCIIAKL